MKFELKPSQALGRNFLVGAIKTRRVCIWELCKNARLTTQRTVKFTFEHVSTCIPILQTCRDYWLKNFRKKKARISRNRDSGMSQSSRPRARARADAQWRHLLMWKGGCSATHYSHVLTTLPRTHHQLYHHPYELYIYWKRCSNKTETASGRSGSRMRTDIIFIYSFIVCRATRFIQ